MSSVRSITPEALAELPQCAPGKIAPARAWRCVQLLGEAFARWMFHPALLQQAATYLETIGDPAGAMTLCQRPRLPEASGCCWVVFVVTPPDSYPCLSPACVLPLQWQHGKSHSAALPAALCQQADWVLEMLREESSKDSPYHEPWGLHLAPGTGLDAYDFSQLTSITCHSGFASLAAGLIVAAEGGVPRANVWASASWGADFRPERVEGLTEKLQLAAEWGATAFFVAHSQVEEARAEASRQCPTLVIHGLGDVPPAGPTKLVSAPVKTALAPYLEQLETPPTANASPQQRTAYYLRRRQHAPDAARQYYREFLLSDIAERCRALLPDDFTPPAVLVTVLSESPELVSLAAHVVRPKVCIVLFTAKLEPQLSTEVNWLQQSLAVDIVPMEVDEDPAGWFDQLPAMLRARLSEGPPGPVFFDLTPGLKYMTVGLTLAARPGEKLLYLIHEFKNGPIPLTERPLVRDVSTNA